MESVQREESSMTYFTLAIGGVSCFFLGMFSWLICSKFFRWFRIDKSNIWCFQKDIMEIKNTTIQIAKDWIETTKFVKEMKGHQTDLVDRLQSEFETKYEELGHTISATLEEKFSRNEELCTKIMRAVESMQESILSMKLYLQATAQKSELMSIGDSSDARKGHAALVNNSAQTVYEIKRKMRDGRTKSTVNTEHEAGKLITLVKKCLTDLMKDAKLHLSIDREEENKELQDIFAKLSQDREDIKRTIVHAFSLAAEQAKRNYNQFGHIGQEAMHYIAALNENTNNILKTKLEKADDRLKEILNSIKRQNIDAVSIRETLENIDGQFDEIFQRVELGCQRNTDHCEEMAQSLEKASSNWLDTASELERVAKEFSKDTKQMKEMLLEMRNLVNFVQQKDVVNIQENKKGSNEIAQYESIASTTTQDLRILSQKQRSIILMYSVIMSCWEKMTCMNNRVQSGCEDLCKLIEMLRMKLLSLNEAVGKLDDVLRNADLDNLVSRISNTKCHDVNSEEILETILRTNRGDRGNAQPLVFKQISGKLENENLTRKGPSAGTIDKELNMIELILRKVWENRSLRPKKEIVSLPSLQSSVNVTEDSEEAVDGKKPDCEKKQEIDDPDEDKPPNSST